VTADQELLGALVGVHVAPELVDVKILAPAATNFVPSAEEAMETQ
jgi:hypothetical protein